ncbi:transposable element Tcb1 transposase [Trichonephila clavipes]|nr:transposable element Tcb1 transposase [Trichonephila clavipes]
MQLLPWPAYLQDMLPVEHVWDLVCRRLARDSCPAASKDEFLLRIQNQNSHSLSRRRNCSSSTVVQERDCLRRRRIVRQNMYSTVPQLTQIVNQGSSQQISAQTMRIELQRIGKHSRLPMRKPLISVRNAKSHLQWFWERKHWTSEEWKRVMWWDESRIPYFALMEYSLMRIPLSHLALLALCKGLVGVS